MRTQTYDARCVNIVDGDTLDIVVNQGLGTYQQIRIRLAGVDTAETYGVSHDSAEYKRGKKHESFVRKWINNAGEEWPFTAVIHKQGKYGRYITTLKNDTETALNDALIAAFDDVSY